MNSTNAGIALLMGFVAGQAARDVYLGELFGTLGVFEIALLAFGLIALLSQIGLWVFARGEVALLRREWRKVVAVNVTTAIAWLCYFAALQRVEPVAANLVFSGVAPIAVLGWAAVGLKVRSHHAAPGVLGVCLAMATTLAALALIVALGGSSLQSLDPAIGLIGLSFAAVSGIAITSETVVAKQLNEAGVSALAIVGVRFTLVALIAAVVTAMQPVAYAGMDAGDIARQGGVFLIILLLPIYLAQAGLKLTSPLTSGLVLSLCPVATLALQRTAGAIELVPAMMLVTACYCLVAIAGVMQSAGFNFAPLRRQRDAESLKPSK